MSDGSRAFFSEVMGEITNRLRAQGGGRQVRVGLTTLGSEHPPEELVRGALLAMDKDKGVEVILIGDAAGSNLKCHPAANDDEQHKIMEQLMDSGEIDGAVTAHYPFPIGVSTVGRFVTPARGKEMFIATTTGTAATERVQAMVKNAVFGIAVAKAAGISRPRIGIINVDGARQVELHLEKMRQNGYDFDWGTSARAEGGRVLRGNDLLMGSVDVAVTDTLTGNILAKVFSAFTTGGNYESVGYGYGPGVGEGFNRLVMIISRASGAPVVAGAIRYCAEMVRGGLFDIAAREIRAAERAGWTVQSEKRAPLEVREVQPPPAKVATAQIAGIDILQLEEAVHSLWAAGIYAASGMGCTGPVLLTAEEDREQAIGLLVDKGFLSASV